MSKYAIVWGQSNCQYCDSAKALLAYHGYTVIEKKIGVNCTKEEFIDNNPTSRSVPQIWLRVENGFAGLQKVLNDKV